MQANLRWDSSRIDHSKDAFNTALGIDNNRLDEIRKSVEGVLRSVKDKVKCLQTLVEGGIIQDAHELVMAVGYAEFMIMQSQRQEEDKARQIGFAVGFIMSMIEKGTIDRFVETLKKKHAETPVGSRPTIGIEVEITSDKAEKKDSGNNENETKKDLN